MQSSFLHHEHSEEPYVCEGSDDTRGGMILGQLAELRLSVEGGEVDAGRGRPSDLGRRLHWVCKDDALGLHAQGHHRFRLCGSATFESIPAQALMYRRRSKLEGMSYSAPSAPWLTGSIPELPNAGYLSSKRSSLQDCSEADKLAMNAEK